MYLVVAGKSVVCTTVVVVNCSQIRETHRQKEKEMKNFAELVSRTSKHTTLQVETAHDYSFLVDFGAL